MDQNKQDDFVNSLIESSADKFKKMRKFDKKRVTALSRNANEIMDLVEFINVILAEHGVTESINVNQIRFYSSFIGNILPPITDKKLSELIFSYSFPKPNLSSYYHYTSISAAKNIFANKELRLYNLRKRFSEDEYVKFYSDHGVQNTNKPSIMLGINSSDKAIMSEIFYISFTSLGADFSGESKWLDFGDIGRGVRIEFEVFPKHNDFREVYYSLHKNANCIPLVKDLFARIEDRFKLPFDFSYFSKIGAFYINGKFSNEKEFRFIVKRTADNYSANSLTSISTDLEESIAYIEIPFNSDFGNFKIKSIQPGYNCSDMDIKYLESIVSSKLSEIILHPRAREFYDM